MQIVFTETNSCRNQITEIFGIEISDMPCIPRVGEKIILTDFIPKKSSKETIEAVERLAACEVADVCYTKDKILINVWEC